MEISWVDFIKPDTRDQIQIFENQMGGYGSQGWEAAFTWERDKSLYILKKTKSQ